MPYGSQYAYPYQQERKGQQPETMAPQYWGLPLYVEGFDQDSRHACAAPGTAWGSQGAQEWAQFAQYEESFQQIQPPQWLGPAPHQHQHQQPDQQLFWVEQQTHPVPLQPRGQHARWPPAAAGSPGRRRRPEANSGRGRTGTAADEPPRRPGAGQLVEQGAGGKAPPAGRRRRKNFIEGGPKKPATSFVLFSNTMRQEVKAACPDISFTDLGRKLGAMWRAMDPSMRKQYNDKASADIEQYLAEKKAWLMAKYTTRGLSASQSGEEMQQPSSVLPRP